MFIIIVQLISYLRNDGRSLLKNALNLPRLLKEGLRHPFVRSFAVVILLYLPWLPALYGQTTMVQGDFWLPRPKPSDLWFLYSHFIAGFSKLPIEAFILLGGLLLLYLRGFTRKTDSILYLWLFSPAVLTFFISQASRPLFFDRYLIISASAISLLLSSQRSKDVRGRKIRAVILTLFAVGLVFVNIYAFNHPVKQPFRDVAQFVYQTYGKDKMVINFYTDALHYFELKHYNVNVKIYSPSGPLPFWVGTALIDPNDVLKELPKDKTLLIMAGGQINRVGVPGYEELRRERFGNLYLLWFIKS